MSTRVRAIHISGPLLRSAAVQHRLWHAVESVDPEFQSGIGPSWVISGVVLDDGQAVFVAHAVRRRWTTVARSVDGLIQRVRRDFPHGRVGRGATTDSGRGPEAESEAESEVRHRERAFGDAL